MFSDNLSTSILQLCDAYKLSYEAASERCGLSSRYFGSIARGQATASIYTQEKQCIGFDCTPNELLRVSPPDLKLVTSMPVTGIRCLMLSGKPSFFPVCPQCGFPLEREFQNCCVHCGQRLAWKGYPKAAIILTGK